jgi:hypothetical protein
LLHIALRRVAFCYEDKNLTSKADKSTKMDDVAKAAGVSMATVSRALNEISGVRLQTVERVKIAAAALQYRAPRSRERPGFGTFAAGKWVGQTINIAVITCGGTREWLQMPVMTCVLEGIRRGANEFGMRLLLEEAPVPSEAIPLVRVQGRYVDGAIIFVAGPLPIGAYEPRACYALPLNPRIRFESIRHANAMKCSPATVAGSRS